ncbi:acyl-CoA thioesterase [Allomesorhizobium camelthorni]|uniref:Acyl-CoA thioesterase n=1 Tax=Allomesorhizobium camelthorni TaxID=475069 RepID=A0A6G4WF85_9HYPH|nr:thioesterase family protein [Mesorhizobium camelthorni]NGO53452.1 acyl-CoA thioesterase [Mesorhizobium camelthorni]
MTASRDQFCSWTAEKIRNADTDRFGHVNNSVVSTYLEAGRTEIMDDALSACPNGRDDYNVLIASLSINFRSELHFPGWVQIGSTVICIGNSSLRMAQAVFADGRLVADCEGTCVLTNAKTGRPTRVPEPVRAFLLRPASMPRPILNPTGR